MALSLLGAPAAHRDELESGAPAQESSEPKARIFISYSRKDIAFADRLEAALKARGLDPLIDRSQIYAFEEWWKRIEALIARADTVVFVLSPDAVTSDVALREISFAATLNKRFAPVVCRPVDSNVIPEAVRRLNFVSFEEPASFEESADKLVEALSTDIVWVRQHTDFGEQARRWALAESPAGLLLRSPLLEQAERWIASRPRGAPTATEETQAFISRSRQAATRRRNTLTGSLAAGLVLALALAGLAYWQRGIAVEQTHIAEERRVFAEQQQIIAEQQKQIAVEQRGIAEQNEATAKDERDKATRNFKLAQKTAESLVFDIVQEMRETLGMPADTVRRILENARTTFEQLGAAAPDDLALQRSRSAMLSEFGDTYLTLGDLPQAFTAYRESLAIMERLVKADPGNGLWQRDLSVAYDSVADVLVAQGNLAEALQVYGASLAIREQLVKANPSKAGWQRDLSISYEHLGDVLVAQGKLAEALKAYRDSLAIAGHLAKSDPGNSDWQRNVSVLSTKVGNVLAAQGNLAEALNAYRDSLTIAERLAKSDPRNAGWQRDLSMSYEIGNALRAQGNLAEALKPYHDSLAIAERLAKSDPGNVVWQRDLSVAYNKVSDILVAQGHPAEALKAYRESLAIREQLAKSDPDNAGWQRDVAVAHSKLATVYLELSDIAAALIELRKGREIIVKLAAIAPDNVQWKRDLAWFEDESARLEGQAEGANKN